MCGICGLVYRDPRKQPQPDLLRRMSDTIRHRGPDDKGIEIQGSAGLAHQRLSIIDLSTAGRQPMSNEDGSVWIVYNGEVYNFRELREQLCSQHEFRSNSDTEVLIHLYEEQGEQMVRQLDGMFAFAILDLNKRKIFLARDPFGIKPLYYSFNQSRFLFGSEIKPLLASNEVDKQIDTAALNDYFDFHWIPAPRSIYKDIRKLPHAHTVTIDLTRWDLSMDRYWKPEYSPEYGRTIDDWCEEVDYELAQSIRSQMVSDVPLGTFLSGGIDSTLVTYHAAKSADEKLKTFTIDFDDKERSEGDCARVVTDRLSTEAIFQTLPYESLASLEYLSQYYDEPFADSSLLPTSSVSRLARENVTVILSGDGGDELFTGYRAHRQAIQLSRLDRLPTWATRGMFGTLASLSPSNTRVHEWSRRLALSPIRRRASLLRLPGREVRLDVLAPELREPRDARFWHIDQHESELRGLPPITQVQFYDMAMYLPNDILVKVDRASMACSLEVRVPILSPRIANLAFRIPESIRFDPRIQKPILRRLVARHFGQKLAYRRKHGFSIPRTKWFAEAASEERCQSILSSGPVREGILCPLQINRLFQSIRSDGGKMFVNRTEEIFAIMIFCRWWERFIDGG